MDLYTILQKMDLLFVNADSLINAYQELSENYSSINPSTGALLRAQACQKIYFLVLMKREFELNFPLVLH